MTNLKEKVEEKQSVATTTLKEAKAKLQEKQKEATKMLDQAKENLEQKETVANGRFTQAKGLVQEKWGELTNNESMRRAGKKEQAKGYLQATYGNNWAVKNRGTVMAVTTLVAVLTYFLFRRNKATA